MENLNDKRRKKCQNKFMPFKIALSLLTTTYKYADRKCPVLLDFASCTNCSAVTIEMYCMKDDKVKCVVIDQNSKL